MGIVLNTRARYVTFLEKGKSFDPNLIGTNIDNILLGSKPACAWWGSSITAEYDWEDYCIAAEISENYNFNKPIYWHLSPVNKVFRITPDDVFIINDSNTFLKYIDIIDIHSDKHFFENDSGKIDTLKLEMLKGEQPMTFLWHHFAPVINFKRMADDGIDALELTDGCIGHFLQILWKSYLTLGIAKV